MRGSHPSNAAGAVEASDPQREGTDPQVFGW